MNLLPIILGSLLSVTLASVVYSGGQTTAILAELNKYRSRLARGIEPWRGFPLQPKLKFPSSTKMYALKWDPTLATSASQRLDTLVFNPEDQDGFIVGNLSGKVHGTVQPALNEFGVGIERHETGTIIGKLNRMTAMQMWYMHYNFTDTYSDFPNPPFFNKYPGYTFYNGHYSYNDGINQIANIFDGGAQKVGCAYRNMTGIKKYAILCQLSPNGLVVGQPLYPTGTPIGSGCPSTHPLNAATGLCTAP